MKSVMNAEQESAGFSGLDFVVGLIVLGATLVGSILAVQYFILP